MSKDEIVINVSGLSPKCRDLLFSTIRDALQSNANEIKFSLLSYNTISNHEGDVFKEMRGWAKSAEDEAFKLSQWRRDCK